MIDLNKFCKCEQISFLTCCVLKVSLLVQSRTAVSAFSVISSTTGFIQKANIKTSVMSMMGSVFPAGSILLVGATTGYTEFLHFVAVSLPDAVALASSTLFAFATFLQFTVSLSSLLLSLVHFFKRFIRAILICRFTQCNVEQFILMGWLAVLSIGPSKQNPEKDLHHLRAMAQADLIKMIPKLERWGCGSS